MYEKHWFFFHVDIRDAHRAFDGEQEDCDYYVQFLGWKSGVKQMERKSIEVFEDEEQD